MVIEVTDSLEFSDILRENKFVVLDIFADWCAPCKKIEPEFASLEKNEEFTPVKFVKINIENMDDMCLDFETPKTIPSFYLIRDGSLVETLKGTNMDNLKVAIMNLVK
jgi:thioredoxin 1